MRRSFCELVAQALKEERVPKGKAILFHFKEDGPLVYHNQCDLDFTYHLPMGEADIAMKHWLARFQTFSNLVKSTDSDCIPIFAAIYENTGGDCNVNHLYWQYERGVVVDAQYMIKHTCAYLGITPRVLILLCIFTGTDFFDKSIVLFNVGVKKLVPAVQLVKKWLVDFGKDDGAGDLEIFKRFLFAVYGRYIKGGYASYQEKDESTGKNVMQWNKFLEDLRPRCPKSSRPPTEATVRAALKRIQFNFTYWTSFPDITVQSAHTAKKKKVAAHAASSSSSSSSCSSDTEAAGAGAAAAAAAACVAE
jgi:hypothetical protein